MSPSPSPFRTKENKKSWEAEEGKKIIARRHSNDNEQKDSWDKREREE